MSTPERCLKCEWWNHGIGKCSRVVKGRLRIGPDSGEIDIETLPGVIPDHLQEEFEAWLFDAISTAVDSYPGWPEIKRLRDQQGCAAKVTNKAIKEFGVGIKLVKPLGEPQPELNLDSHGLFKADTSLL